MRGDGLTDRNKTDRLIELIDELVLSAGETKAKRFPISPADVHLIAWLAVIPETANQLNKSAMPRRGPPTLN